jgi:hypothetical protein
MTSERLFSVISAGQRINWRPFWPLFYEDLYLGFKPLDALHVAAAEQGQAEVLVTCDDGLIKTAQRHTEILQVKIMSVLHFIAKEI